MTQLLLEPRAEAPLKELEEGTPGKPLSAPAVISPLLGTRDLRLDLLRGFCILGMLFLHGLGTPFLRVACVLGFVSVAEGFFFISGAIVGIVYRRRLAGEVFSAVTKKIWLRAGQLYAANLLLVILFAFLEAHELVPMRKFAWRWGADWTWPRVFAIDQPYFLQILPRYSLFLLFTPLCLYLLSKRQTLAVALTCGAIYAAHLFRHQSLFLPFFESGRVGFHVAAWQLLFFGGIIIGWHRAEIARFRSVIFHPMMVAVTAIACAIFAVLAVLVEFHAITIPRENFLFARPHLGPLRLVNVLVLFIFLFWACDRFWPIIEKYTGRLFIPSGQNGLYVYLAHIPIIVFIEMTVYDGLKLPKSSWWYIVPNLLFVALMLWMVRRKVLFGVIPR